MSNPNGYAPPPAGPPGKGLSIASMVLGICSLLFPFIGLAWLSIFLAIVGLVLGVLGKKKDVAVGAPTGMATAGIVTSVVALAFAVLMTILCATLCAGIASLGGLGW